MKLPIQFLTQLQNPLITRICFNQCNNYKQEGMYIKQSYINDSVSAVTFSLDDFDASVFKF